MPFTATQMNLEKIILSEVSQKKTNTWYHLHMESKNIYTNEFIYKIETDSQTQKTNMITNEEVGVREKLAQD